MGRELFQGGFGRLQAVQRKDGGVYFHFAMGQNFRNLPEDGRRFPALAPVVGLRVGRIEILGRGGQGGIEQIIFLHRVGEPVIGHRQADVDELGAFGGAENAAAARYGRENALV